MMMEGRCVPEVMIIIMVMVYYFHESIIYSCQVRGKHPVCHILFSILFLTFFLFFFFNYRYPVQTWNSQIHSLYGFILRQRGFSPRRWSCGCSNLNSF